MSQWTHVAGLIRVDTLDGVVFPRDPYMVLTVLAQASSPPEGSEGLLQVRAHETREHNSLNWGCLVVWGDLRDYGNGKQVEEISAWFERFLNTLHAHHYVIRQAVLDVEVEGGPVFLLVSQYDKEFKQVKVLSIPVEVAPT